LHTPSPKAYCLPQSCKKCNLPSRSITLPSVDRIISKNNDRSERSRRIGGWITAPKKGTYNGVQTSRSAEKEEHTWNIEKEPRLQLLRRMAREEWDRLRRNANHIHPVAEPGPPAPPHRAAFGAPQPALKNKVPNRRKPTAKI